MERAITVKIYDVFLADVPFDDVDQTKIRPVVVIGKYACAIDCLKMTSQPPRSGEYVLKRWEEAGLGKPTVIRVSKRLGLPANNLVKKLGRLDPLDILGLQECLE